MGGSGDGGGGTGENGGAGSDGGGTGGLGGTGGSTGGGRGGSAGAGGAPGTKCMGKPGAPGLTTRNIGGRNVLVHIPSTVDPNTGVPLLLVHHGFSMTGDAMRTLTGFQTIANREGFVVAFPTGTGNTWNVGTGACGGAALVSGTADDLAGLWPIVRPAVLARDPRYAGQDSAFCEAYAGNHYAPDLR